MKQCNSILIGLVFLTACRPATQHAKAARQPDTAGCWTDFRIGELPPVNYYEARDSIVRKWKLCYKRVEGGCEATVAEKNQHEKGNDQYFTALAAKYGRDWRERFNKEVQDLDSILHKSRRQEVK